MPSFAGAVPVVDVRGALTDTNPQAALGGAVSPYGVGGSAMYRPAAYVASAGGSDGLSEGWQAIVTGLALALCCVAVLGRLVLAHILAPARGRQEDALYDDDDDEMDGLNLDEDDELDDDRDLSRGQVAARDRADAARRGPPRSIYLTSGKATAGGMGRSGRGSGGRMPPGSRSLLRR